MRRLVDGKLDHAVALLFAAGSRPSVRDIEALSLAQGQFAISLNGGPRAGGVQWVELLANGLTFDLSGLAGGPAEQAVGGAHFMGLPVEQDLSAYEVVTLVPGPHLISGGPMVPVLRCLAWLAAELAGLAGLHAIVWSAARTVCAPDYFREGVNRWLSGGAFPGLGLTALAMQDDGSLASEGLELFIGQELVLHADIARDRPQAAKLAVRLLHWLVEGGAVTYTQTLTGPSGEVLILTPQSDGRQVLVTGGSR